MHRFRDISKNVFLIQQIFTCKQYGAHKPDSQQPNLSDDLSIDKHWPWVVHGDHVSIWHNYGDIVPQMLDARMLARKERRKKEKKKKKGKERGKQRRR